MRRRDPRERSTQTAATRSRRAFVALYTRVGGYGVRSMLPAVWLGMLLLVGWALVATVGLDKGRLGRRARLRDAQHAAAAQQRERLDDDRRRRAMQVALRVLGPILIGLVVLGVRAQVKR